MISLETLERAVNAMIARRKPHAEGWYERKCACEQTLSKRKVMDVGLLAVCVQRSAGHIRKLARDGRIPGAHVDRYFTPAGMRTGWVFSCPEVDPYIKARLTAAGLWPAQDS